MRKPGVPLVRFRILVKGGAEAEPPELAGLAGVTAQLLRKGTAKRTAAQFSDELDFLGGTFQTGGFAEQYSSATTINGEFLTKDFDQGLDLLTDAVLHPTFPQQEVDKLLAQRVDAVKSAKDNPQAAIPSYYGAFFFGPKHPFGHPPDELTLARVRRDDIAAFHKRLYCGRNLIVIVTGDFDTASAEAKIASAFGQGEAGTAFVWNSPASPAPKTRLLLVDKPDATQTYFYIGQPGIDRHNPDRIKLLILNTLFGGRFTSMLNDELRVNSGLTYGAFSAVQEYRVPGSIYISTYTKTETTGKAIDVALEILKKLSEKGITPEQLASAKAYIKGTFPPDRLETADQLSATLADLELYGLGRDEIDNLFARIDAVSLDDANQAARKYFRTDRLTFVALGNAAKIRDAVKKYSDEVTEISIKDPGFRGVR
ncbi:MAG TPA: pitrilysin family protein [Bryobacteraceae bacterium]|nr:pitrilysin family protein [Bryobacteraceae bacterium]